MKVLIGNTGLIGKTLLDSMEFDLTFNSANIETLSTYDLTGSELYLSCLPATKWKINQDPAGDFNNMSSIFSKLIGPHYSKIRLLSTIDVYCDSPAGLNEDFAPIVKSLNYGSNRYFFELAIQKLSANSIQIFRLPALFGKHIKKNILFDLLNNNNVDQIKYLSKFQWYNLSRLSEDLVKYDDSSSKTVNLFNEPLETRIILEMFGLNEFNVNQQGPPIKYDWKTKYSKTGYHQSAKQVSLEINDFIDAFRN
jgi:hypothetical protein